MPIHVKLFTNCVTGCAVPLFRPILPPGSGLARFDPHITIAYCNADVSAAQAVAAVKAVNGSASAALTVAYVSLVLLTRLPRAYRWESVSRLPAVSGVSATDCQRQYGRS